MYLSLVVPVYKEANRLAAFFKAIGNQTSHDFELILVIDTGINNPLREVTQNYSRLAQATDERLIVLFNTKRLGRTEALNLGIEEATGQYTLIVSVDDFFDEKFVANINEAIKGVNADIIEFNITMRAPIRHAISVRPEFSVPVNIKDHKALFAYVSPFEFNKLFRTTVLKKATRFKLNAKTNSRYSIERTYTALVVAETYVALPRTFTVAYASLSLNFNPLKLLKQWKALASFLKENQTQDFSSEWVYAFVNMQLNFTAKLVKESRRAFRQNYFEALREELRHLSAKNNFYFESNPKLLAAWEKY